MARPMTADEIIRQFRKWKVPYKEYSGWRTRFRPQTFGPIHGVMIHHTGSDAQSEGYLDFLFVGGRPEEGIPAPLCNFATQMDGDVWIGAVGRANDSGKGSSRTLTLVTNESYNGYSDEIEPGPDDIDGNKHYYDFEAMFDGGQVMTNPQYRSTVLGTCAILDFYGWSALSAIGHREHSRRKWDPGKTPMDKFRRDVRAQLLAGPPGSTTTPVPAPVEEDFVTTQAEFNKFMNNWVLTELDPGDTTAATMSTVKRAFGSTFLHMIIGRNDGVTIDPVTGKPKPLVNVHSVLGTLWAKLTVIDSLPQLIKEAGDEVSLTPEQIADLEARVSFKLAAKIDAAMPTAEAIAEEFANEAAERWQN